MESKKGGAYRDNGKENGNYYSIIGHILELYRDNGKENGNYYGIIGYILGLYRDNGKEIKTSMLSKGA